MPASAPAGAGFVSSGREVTGLGAGEAAGFALPAVAAGLAAGFGRGRELLPPL